MDSLRSLAVNAHACFRSASAWFPVRVGWALSVLLCLPLLVAPGRALAQQAQVQPAQERDAQEAQDVDTEGSEAPGAGPQIVAPELLTYSPPVYPEEAFAQGREAVVQLSITVNEDGSVSDPEVIESQGHGFDEAALTAALGLKFSPALVGGDPRKVRIGFQYVFEIDEAEQTAAEAREEAPRVGEIGGTLLLSGAETPLPGVKVVVIDALGMKYETTTDVQGRWLLTAMAPGVYRVEVKAEGFESVLSEERVIAGEGTEIVFRIVPETSETEVVVRGERPPREVTRRVLERREVQRIPGTSGDALRSIQSLPGVARPPALAGLLIVRGSAAGDSGTYIDGAEVPLIYHFGGLSSVVPTEFIDELNFYPGNFSVRYGRYRGGIVDVGLRKPNTDCYGDYGVQTNRKDCYHGLAQFDLVDMRLMAQGPIPKAKDWSFAVAGRRSWIDTWLRPVLEAAGSNVTSAPVYYDYQALIERNRGPSDKLSFRFFGSDDRLELILANPAAQDPGFGGNLRFATSFMRGQVLYRKDLTPDTNLDTMISVGSQQADFALGGNLKFELRTIPIDIRSEIGHRVHRTAKVNVGLDFQITPYEAYVRAPPVPREGEAASGPFATQVPLETSASGTIFRPAWYGDVEWQPHSRLRLVPGVRLDYARDSGHVDLSPRFNARYTLIKPESGFWFGKPLGTVLKGGVGKYSQPPTFDETDRIFGTPGIESNQSIHYAVGFEQDVTRQIDLSVEGYYKDFYNSVSRTTDLFGNQVYENEGLGHVLGMETQLKYNPDDRFFGWVSYTLSRSVRRECAGCPLRKFQYDQTHNVIVVGSYRLGRGWEFGARFRIVSGPLVTPVSDPNNVPALFAGDSGSYLPLQGRPYSERLPLFHQLDVRIDKLWQFRHFRFSTYLDIWNVYNHAAKEGLLYNYNFSQRAYQTGLPILPSLGVRGEF